MRDFILWLPSALLLFSTFSLLVVSLYGLRVDFTPYEWKAFKFQAGLCFLPVAFLWLVNLAGVWFEIVLEWSK
jgi:hypothetical protein